MKSWKRIVLILLLHLVLGPLLGGTLVLTIVALYHGFSSHMLDADGLLAVIYVSYIVGAIPALAVGSYVAWKSQRGICYRHLGLIIVAFSMVFALMLTALQANLDSTLSRKGGMEEKTFMDLFLDYLWSNFPIQFAIIAVTAAFASIVCLTIARRFKLVASTPSTLSVSA